MQYCADSGEPKDSMKCRECGSSPRVKTPPSCRWLSLKRVRLARNRAWRELEASPSTPNSEPQRPVLGANGSPLLEVQKDPSCWPTCQAKPLSSHAVRIASVGRGLSDNRNSPAASVDTGNMCLIVRGDLLLRLKLTI
ncbi:hypothetical protein Efla_001532 [Eimeria flavescens]